LNGFIKKPNHMRLGFLMHILGLTPHPMRNADQAHAKIIRLNSTARDGIGGATPLFVSGPV
jgi:hypothetical protein